jgi:hypothetical protein
VLLLGVPTTATAVADTLPSPALTRLATERFSLPSATASLDALVRTLFTDRGAGVVLGRRSFAYLVEAFLGDHLSVRQLARALQARDVPPAPVSPGWRLRRRRLTVRPTDSMR